jgi:hypothetical protein
MSNALAVAGVTAVLQHFLNAVYNGPGSVLGSVSVSAIAPDIIQEGMNKAGKTPLQVNLFLHQVTLNPAWRNMEFPSLAGDGRTRQGNPPLALDLHYLLTAYAPEDSQAEALIGYGVFFLHQNPVLPRSEISAALASLPASYPIGFANALALSGLADQVEMIKITPATLGREELAWLWTALKADYRPTFPFLVSVVLVQPQNPLTSALPVLRRVAAAQPSLLSPLPALTKAEPPAGQPAACLGDTVTVQGTHLQGASGVVLINRQKGVERSITTLLNSTDSSFQFAIPNDPAALPAGVYLLNAQVPSGSDSLQTNGLALAIAPRIDSSWPPGPLTSGANVAVTVPCLPDVRPGQQVSLVIGSQEAPADAFTSPTGSPSFTFPSLEATTSPVPVRLRVDGLDSPIVDRTKTPPLFSGTSVQVN